LPPNEPEPFDSAPLLEVLAQHDVDFVVIGGVAGGAHGSSYGTYDLDVAYERSQENLERLAEALRSLDARLRGAPPEVPFILDAATLEAGGNFTFDTRLGWLDVFAYLAGSPPYDRLRADALAIEIGSQRVLIASLDHLIAMKEAAGRPKDKLAATEYRTLSNELHGPNE
jgi:hypothetical protein